MARIVIAGALDTKSEPFGHLVDALRRLGEEPVVIDTSVFAGDPSATFSAETVAREAGHSHGSVAALGRAEAVGVMATGAARIVAGLVRSGEIGALVCMGGSNAASVFSQLSPVVPLGIPKILMSTSVAGDTRPAMGANDVVLLYPVVDVDGGSAILRRMIDRLASTAKALKSTESFEGMRRARRTIALSMYGVTTPCVQQVARLVREAEWEPLVFHANGTGGRSIEAFAEQRLVDGVVDATLAEIGNELLGGAFPAGPDRLQGAARAGIPQIVAPGGIDMIAFGPRPSVPERFREHRMISHNRLVTLVRTTPEECYRIGQRTAERLGAPKAATAVCIPLGGASMLDREGEAFWDPDAMSAFRNGLREQVAGGVEILESACNINDPDFAQLLFGKLRDALTA